MAKYIEVGTNYAYTIERIENITFTKLRAVAIDFTRRLPSSLTDELYKDMQHGVCQLQSESALNMYLYSFGLMHEAKLQHAFQHLPSDFTDHEAIEIIDYGCGQAIGTICYADFLRKIGKTQKVKKVTLIEPSKRALERAALHTSCFLPEAEVVTINKGFDDLVEDDLCIDEEIPTLHIFSNVIDLADDYFNLEKFAMLINDCAKGENYYICIEPYFDYDEQDEKLQRVVKSLDAETYYSNTFLKGTFVEGHDWTCRVVITGTPNVKESTYSKDDSYMLELLEAAKDRYDITTWNRYFETNDNLNNIMYIAHIAESEKRFDDAFACYDVAAMKGNAKACYKVGVYYENVEYDDELAEEWYKRAAEMGYTEAMFRLGRFYAKDASVNDACPKAMRWYYQAAALGHAKAQLSLGYNYAMMGEYVEAIKWYLKAHKQGESATYLIAKSYYEMRNYTKAIEWFSKAVEQDDCMAQYYLGCCYEYLKNYTEAVNWYLNFIDSDYAYKFNSHVERVYNTLGYFYKNGLGIIQDYDEAIRWYVKAAERHNIHARNILFNSYIQLYLEGVDLNQCLDKDGVNWCKKLLQHKYVQNEVGHFCEFGKRDYNRAIKWYIMAAEQGYSEAQYNLGNCYANQYGVNREIERNYVEAVKWYHKAAEQGNARAQFNLGVCYTNGWGIDKNNCEAIKWYRKAAEQGIAKAQFKLGKCYKNGDGVKQNDAEAEKWFRLAAKNGHVRYRYIQDEDSLI